MANKTVTIKIKRQLTPDAKPSWEEFDIPYKPNMNVTSALMEIAEARTIAIAGFMVIPFEVRFWGGVRNAKSPPLEGKRAF